MALLSALQRLAGAIAAALLLTALAGQQPALAQTKTEPKAQTKAQTKPGAGLTVAARARVLLRAGRPLAALKVLHPAVKARPSNLTLLFLVGEAGLAAAGRKGIDDKSRTALLDAAIAALRRMLVIQPGLVRARLELARAFFLKREDTLARRHFERVLAGGEYQHPVGKRLRLRVGGDLWRQEYAHSRFDRTLIAGHAGPRWLAGRTYEFSLLGSARQVLSAGEPEYSEFGLRLEAAQRLGPRLFARESAIWHQRTYEDSGGLNGPRWQASLNLSWQATPTLSVGANAGFSAEVPRVSHQRNARPWVQVSANYALPWGFTVGGSANFYRTTYESDPYWRVLTRGDARRVDRGRTYRLTLLNRAFTLGGFSPQLIAIYEERESNAQLSSYKRFRGELRAVRQF